MPVPEVTDFDELNAQLLERCGADDQRRIGGRSDDRTVGERHGAERAYLLALPGTRFENTKVVGVRISPYQTARWIRTGIRCRPHMWDAGSGPISAVTG